MNISHRACLIFIILTVFYREELFAACPGALPVDASMIGLIGSPSEYIQAIAWQDDQFVDIPFDVVELESTGRPRAKSHEVLSSQRFYVSYRAMGEPRRRIRYGDSIVFGKALGGGTPPLAKLTDWAQAKRCSQPSFWAVDIADNKFAFSGKRIFLLKCGDLKAPRNQQGTLNPPLIIFNPKTLEVSGKHFNYRMSQKNQMLFDRLSLIDSRGVFREMAKDGAFDIRADFKNFLTTHFTAGSVRSKVVKYHLGQSGTFIKLKFGLNILFFDIDLDLRTDVLFTSDTVFLPMVMQLPKSAKRYVHSESGVLYSWLPFEGVGVDFTSARMPIRREFRKNFQTRRELASVTAKYCHLNGICSFGASLVSKANQSDPIRLQMEVRLPVELVKKGFFPRLVADIHRESVVAGWRVNHKDSKPEGIYFELSNLDAGEHGMDIWLYFDRKNASQHSIQHTMPCPSILKARALAI